MSSWVYETLHCREDDTVFKKKKERKTDYHPFCVCVCLLFLLHPEQSAAVHKASCYPRDGRLNESLKACVSSVRRAVLLKINLNIGFLLNYSIFLLMEQKSTKKHSFCSSSTLDTFVPDMWFICFWTPTVVPLTYTPAVLRYVYKIELITALLGNCSPSKINKQLLKCGTERLDFLFYNIMTQLCCCLLLFLKTVCLKCTCIQY